MSINYVWPETNVDIRHLPLSNPLCANETCIVFDEARKASQERISWTSQFDYGYYVCFFWGIILGAVVLAKSASRLHYFHATRSRLYFVDDKPTTGEKLVALGRSITYRRATGRIANFKSLPSLGLVLLVLVSWLFAVLVCFVQHPYYRQNRGYGSPPLGVRAGLAGVAMTPIMIALGGKYNLVTLLTGISHEKLNFLHRLCGLIYLFFGLVHTVPFLINAYQSGGAKRVYYQFYYPGSMEWSGIAPFAVLVFLCIFSAPWIRRACYELFVHSHIAAAIAFLGGLFWHCGDTMDSWVYLWATVGIWIIQLAARAWGKTSMFENKHKYRNGTAHVQVLDDECGQAAMLRISIPTSLSWSPGQHAFLRFPRLAFLDNHPFTIASVSRQRGEEDDTADRKIDELLFLVRPYTGVTRRLLEHAQTRSNAEASGEDPISSTGPLKVKAEDSHHVLIDGPYGGLEQHRAMHRLYDHVVLVAGGGGISAMLPWLLSLSRKIANLDEPCRVQRVDLIWCIRHASARAWVEEELQECLRLAGDCVHVDVYVTDGKPGDVSGSESASEHVDLDDEDTKEKGINVAAREKENGTTDRLFSNHDRTPRVHAGRPYFPECLPRIVNHRRTMIMGCGPESLKIDLSNTAAKLQSKVRRNEADEILLHTETFGW